MAKLRFGSGSVSAEMSDRLEEIARAAIREASPGALEAIEGSMAPILRSAQAEWPVDTGRSRNGLRFEVLLSTNDVRGRIVGDAPYTRWVRPRKWFGARTAWNETVAKPVKAAVREIVKTIGDRLVAAMERRR